jgi:hypothetical protein
VPYFESNSLIFFLQKNQKRAIFNTDPRLTLYLMGAYLCMYIMLQFVCVAPLLLVGKRQFIIVSNQELVTFEGGGGGYLNTIRA